MRRLLLHVCLLAGLGLSAAGCKQTDTILLIELSGPSASTGFEPWQFEATITAGLEAKAFTIPEERRASPLPQSFTLALDSSRTGPITVSVVAHDAFQQPIGAGTTTQRHIVIGGQTIIAVALIAGEPPDDTDGGADAGGGPGDGGADDGADADVGGTQDAPAPDAGDAAGDKPADGMGLDTAPG